VTERPTSIGRSRVAAPIRTGRPPLTPARSVRAAPFGA